MANTKFTHFKGPPPLKQKLLLILLPGLSHHSVGNVAKTTHHWECVLVSYCAIHLGVASFIFFLTKKEYHIPFSSTISNITRNASSCERGPSPPAQLGAGVPQNPWKLAPKDDGLRSKVRTQAIV